MSLNITNKKFIIIGFVAGFSLLAVYFIVLSIANSFSHAIKQFSQIWYWILFLTVGFGLQVGLYFFIRASFRLKQMASPTAAVAASGGISTGSMIACCLHHLVDVLPLMGLAAAAVFLATYQLLFIIIGILSNLIGITIMLEIIQKHKLSEGFLEKTMIYDMNKIKKATIGLSLILFLITFFLINNSSKTNNLLAEAASKESDLLKSISIESIDLSTKIDSRGEVSFEVTPINFSFDNSIKLEIKINTHSGSLDLDLAEISILEDDKGKKYQPMDWQGSPPGGHHRSGILVFPKLDIQTKNIKLTIQDDFGILPRIFEWELN